MKTIGSRYTLVTYFVTFVLVIHISKTFSQISDKGQACFNQQTEDGLLWPIWHSKDIGLHLVHGAHCLQLVEIYNNNPPENNTEWLHNQHCLTLLERVQKFFEENRDYRVPSMLCRDVEEFQSDGLCPFNTNVGMKRCKQVNDIFFYYPYIGKKRRRRRWTEFDAIDNPETKYKKLAGRHFWNLLMRSMQNPESLSQTELRYISQWENDYATRISAMGIYCISGSKGDAPLDLLVDTIDKSKRRIAEHNNEVQSAM